MSEETAVLLLRAGTKGADLYDDLEDPFFPVEPVPEQVSWLVTS